jgi:predicted transglutaminase-like cysteine proteinase
MRSISIKYLLFVLCIAFIPSMQSLAAERAAKPAYMPIGKGMLPPFSFSKFCVRKPERCAPSENVQQIPFDADNRKKLEQVQHDVNRSISGLEKWNDDATRNDCTDYALTKRSRLLDMGYPSSALLIAVAFVPNGVAHLLLVVATDQGDFVLDNLRQNVVRWDQLPYRWVMRSTPQDPKRWQAILPLFVGPGFESVENSLAICR